VGCRDRGKREPRGDIEPLPSCAEGLVDVACRCGLGVGGDVIAADEEHADVLEEQRPEGNAWGGVIRGVGRDRSVEREHVQIRGDVRGERYLHDVIDAVRRERTDFIDECGAGHADMMRPCAPRGRFVTLRSDRRDHSGSGAAGELNGTDAHRTRTERAAIVEFVRNGGRVLVVAEEERRMDLAARGVCRDIGSRDVNEAQPEGC
jgi:hypothetical protein